MPILDHSKSRQTPSLIQGRDMARLHGRQRGGASLPYLDEASYGPLIAGYHPSVAHYTDLAGTTEASTGQLIRAVANFGSLDVLWKLVDESDDSSRPTYDATLFGGAGGIEFQNENGLWTEDFQNDAGRISTADGWTMYYVYHMHTTGVQDGRYGLVTTWDIDQTEIAFLFNDAGTAGARLFVGALSGITLNHSTPNHFTAVGIDGDSAAFYRGRSGVGTSNSGNAPTMITRMGMNANAPWSGSDMGPGRCGAALLYNAIHDASQRAGIWGALEAEFGL